MSINEDMGRSTDDDFERIVDDTMDDNSQPDGQVMADTERAALDATSTEILNELASSIVTGDGSFSSSIASTTSSSSLRQRKSLSAKKSVMAADTTDQATDDVEEVVTSVSKKVIKRVVWRIKNFADSDESMDSPLMTELFGNNIKLRLTNYCDQVTVCLKTEQAKECNQDDQQRWNNLSFEISCGDVLTRTSTDDGIFSILSLGSKEEVLELLDRDGDLLVKLSITAIVVENHLPPITQKSALSSKVSENYSAITGLIHKLTNTEDVKVALLTLALASLLFVLLVLSSTGARNKGPFEDYSGIKSHLLKIEATVAEHNVSLSEVDSALTLFKTLSEKVDDLSLQLELLKMHQKSRNNSFKNLLNDLKKSVCDVSHKYLPRQMQITSCLDPPSDSL